MWNNQTLKYSAEVLQVGYIILQQTYISKMLFTDKYQEWLNVNCPNMPLSNLLMAVSEKQILFNKKYAILIFKCKCKTWRGVVYTCVYNDVTRYMLMYTGRFSEVVHMCKAWILRGLHWRHKIVWNTVRSWRKCRTV